LTNFLYELEVGQTPAEKPESGRVCGPKGSPKVLLGRLGGRGKVRPNAGKKMFFLLFVSSRIFFCLLSLLLFLALGGGHSSLSFVPTTVSPPTKLHTRVAHIPPPPSCTFCDCPAHPLPPEIARVAPPNPSFCFPLGPISKGWSTTMCSAVGAGPSKVPPQPPYLSPPSISLTLTSLLLFDRPKKTQHFPVRKVVRLP
jgi:hypothetical protein